MRVISWLSLSLFRLNKKGLGIRSAVTILKEASRDQGYSLVFNAVSHLLYYLYYKKLRIGQRSHNFVFRGKTYSYFYSFYHATYMNERAVEIPIVMELINKNVSKRILEVGNVLSHYFETNHTVLDKYEKGNGVINQDIVDFSSDIRYDLIVSISTLEHVGWDEIPRDDKKILKAISNMRQLLAPNGTIIITLPIGHNTFLDSLLRGKVLVFDQQYYLLRISKSNQWREATWEEVKDRQYGIPYENANAVVIGIISSTEIL